MEPRTRRKRDRKTAEEKNCEDAGGATLAVSAVRNWSDLPEGPLQSILDRLSTSIPDLLSFAGVCRSFSSLAAATPLASLPPLLLSPVLRPSLHSGCRLATFADPPRCRLQTLTLTPDSRSYRSQIPSWALIGRCLGYSHGHLIVYRYSRIVIVDVFTGKQIRPPKLPSFNQNGLSSGILTGPRSSSSCTLCLLTSDCCDILTWRLGSKQWSALKIGNSRGIEAFVLFKGQIYCLDQLSQLAVVQFTPSLGWKQLDVQFHDFVMPCSENFGKRLVECNGELLLVMFTSFWLPLNSSMINIYRLDLSLYSWVKVESLGDWCLFIDTVGNCPAACANPARWGGRKNCIYIAGPGCDSWRVISLDDGMEIDMSDSDSPLSPLYATMPKWPSPIWVYPSMFY